MTSIIEARELSRWYGLVMGLNNVSFQIETGLTGLVGPNHDDAVGNVGAPVCRSGCDGCCHGPLFSGGHAAAKGIHAELAPSQIVRVSVAGGELVQSIE